MTADPREYGWTEAEDDELHSLELALFGTAGGAPRRRLSDEEWHRYQALNAHLNKCLGRWLSVVCRPWKDRHPEGVSTAAQLS